MAERKETISPVALGLISDPPTLVLTYDLLTPGMGVKKKRRKRKMPLRDFTDSSNVKRYAFNLRQRHSQYLVGVIEVSLEKMLRIIQEIQKGNSVESSLKIVEKEYFIDPNEDLNKLSPSQLAQKKAVMDETFHKNLLRPGDPGYVYDKEVSFENVKTEQRDENDWDEDEEKQKEDVEEKEEILNGETCDKKENNDDDDISSAADVSKSGNQSLSLRNNNIEEIEKSQDKDNLPLSLDHETIDICNTQENDKVSIVPILEKKVESCNNNEVGIENELVSIEVELESEPPNFIAIEKSMSDTDAREENESKKSSGEQESACESHNEVGVSVNEFHDQVHLDDANKDSEISTGAESKNIEKVNSESSPEDVDKNAQKSSSGKLSEENEEEVDKIMEKSAKVDAESNVPNDKPMSEPQKWDNELITEEVTSDLDEILESIEGGEAAEEEDEDFWT